MEKHQTGIIPVADYIEYAKDIETHLVPETSDRLYALVLELVEQALLPHLHYAALMGSADSYEIVRSISEDVFGTPFDDVELERIMNSYAYLFTRLSEFNSGGVDDDTVIDDQIGQFNAAVFLASHGPADSNPITVDQVANFVVVGHDEMQELNDKIGNLERYRADFCHDLKKLVTLDLVDQGMLERLEYLARTATISSVRPIDYAANDIDTMNSMVALNPSAYYTANNHSALMNVVSEHGDRRPKVARAFTKSVIYHELIHSITSSWAHMGPNGVLERMDYFPRFVQEASAELLANVMLDEKDVKIIADELDSKYLNVRGLYGAYRNTFHGDKDVSVTAYDDFRFLLDMMMAKLDWETAGIDQVQAEKLLSRALLDGPSGIHDVDHNCKYIRAFHAALTKASFPGFMVHLREIFEHEGIGILLNYFDSPSFDPHDKESLPRTLTTKLYEWERYSDASLEARRPHTQLLEKYAKQHFVYQHGVVEYDLNVALDAEVTDQPNFDRQYQVGQDPTRFFALKAMTRGMMDRRAAERSALLKKRWFAEKRRELEHQKTPV